MTSFAQIIRSSTQEDIDTMWDNIKESSNPTRNIRDIFGEITIDSNGRIHSEHVPNNRPDDEYALLQAISILFIQGALSPIKRLSIQLSADSSFPSCIKPIIDHKDFGTLNLNKYRGSIPRDFWKLCCNFTISNGQPFWHYQIIAPANILGECNFHRLQALCECAREKKYSARNINTLYLWKQNLNRLPNSFGSLENLERLEIWDNPIRKVPQSTTMLFMLQNIIFSKDQKELSKSFNSLLPHVKIGWT
jgi:hypothetical protein